ncbi:hypothetical protein O9992_19895 [Vibrio lentus]|nr:hypothetical protein [Vibrio lentus]
MISKHQKSVMMSVMFSGDKSRIVIRDRKPKIKYWLQHALVKKVKLCLNKQVLKQFSHYRATYWI